MTSIATQILIALLLLAANAFFVAAEFALVKSRGFRVKAMVERRQFGARLVRDIMGNIEAYLACCQLGITMASLGLGWVGEPTVAALLEPGAGREESSRVPTPICRPMFAVLGKLVMDTLAGYWERAPAGCR